LTTEQWERALRVDLTSVFWCLKYQVLAMLATGGGAIVNTASSLDRSPSRTPANTSRPSTVWSASRGRPRRNTAAGDPRERHITRDHPNPHDRPADRRCEIQRNLRQAQGPPPDRAIRRALEIGEAVKWLLSDAASFMNGAAMACDGGYLSI